MSDPVPFMPGLSLDRFPVKVCGITRVEDGCLAWELGAAALGFIFHPKSPRFITPERARALRRQLPEEVFCVGVFVDATADEVNRIADLVHLSAAQLHGFEKDHELERLQMPALKVVRSEEEALASSAARVLVDASLPGVLGGTGLQADWNLARRIADRRPLVLAGGLGPENAREAWEQVRPVGLDVNSGVEHAPGLKDGDRLRALFEALQGPAAMQETKRSLLHDC